jgi:hypothetical protein
VPDWLTWKGVGVFALGVLTGAIIPTHYNDALARHRKRQAAARFLIDHVSKARDHLDGICSQIDTLAPSLGPGVVRDNVLAVEQHRLVIEGSGNLLFDLYDPALKETIEKLGGAWRDAAGQFERQIRRPTFWTEGAPTNLDFMASYRLYQDWIRSGTLRNCDAVLTRLRKLDVSFPAWVIHRVRGWTFRKNLPH